MDNSSVSLYEQNTFLMECFNCSRIWDGNAQCPCLLYTEDEELLKDFHSNYKDLQSRSKENKVGIVGKIQNKVDDIIIKMKVYDDYNTIEYHSDRNIDELIYEIIERIK